MHPLSCTHSQSAAKVFVQLSTRRCIASTSNPAPILDILLPPRTSRPVPPRLPKASYRAFSKPRAKKQSVRIPELQHVRASGIQRRMFSATRTRGATHAVFNPQKDEDGKEMMLEITPRAAKRLSEIMIKDSNPNLALRIQVESGGCHGFQYLMSLVTLPPDLPTAPAEPSTSPEEGADSGKIREDDSIFTYSMEEQSGADLTAPKIILDQPSLELLKGSKVDFTMELIGSQFKIVDNPLATSSCGCGTSFDIKV